MLVETTPDGLGLNPYQPPQTPIGQVDLDAKVEVSFQLNRQLRRHAEAQYLLHWRPKLLLFSSLAMIFGSCVAFIAVPAPVLVTLMIVMVVSAAIYSSLVHRAKQQIRRRQQEHGLMSDGMITIESAPERTTLVAAGQVHVWPSDRMNVYRTSQGVLLCPEPMLYLFVPKQTAQVDGYQEWVELVRARASGGIANAASA